MGDVADFERRYKQHLRNAIDDADMPPALTDRYAFESCIRKDEDGKKELYLLTRRADQAPALLRVTTNYPQEDAIAEAALLDRLDHPAIPKVYARYEHNGRKYMVRAYFPGHTLYDVVKAGGALSVRDIYGIARKLCGVLSYLHGMTPPVIHRDIKPQNIVVATDGSIKLIDFGIARVHKQDRSQDTAIVVSGSYAPPEQYGFDQTSPVADIYSLGMSMLFMATGRTDRTGLDASVKDENLRRLIETCIAFDPQARYQSADEIAKYIDRVSGASKKRRVWLTALTAMLAIACAAA